ncbi:cross-pathway control WD-repeat protein cpc2 [Gurleya vavrai]
MNAILKDITTLDGHNQQVTCITVPEEGNSPIFYTSSRDKKVLQWRFTNNENLALVYKAYEESKHYVHNIASSISNKIISGGADSLARIYDVETKKCQVLVGHKRDVTCVTVNSADNKIVTGSIDGTIFLWNSRGELIEKFDKNHPNMHTDWITCASFIPKKDNLVTGSNDGSIKVWDISTGEILKTFYKGTPEKCSQPGRVITLTITADGNICAYGGADCTVYIVHLDKDALVSTFATETPVTCLAFAWTEAIIAIGTKTHVYLWDVVGDRILQTIKCSDFPNKVFCTSLAWSKNILMVGLSDGKIKAYEYSKETL